MYKHVILRLIPLDSKCCWGGQKDLQSYNRTSIHLILLRERDFSIDEKASLIRNDSYLSIYHTEC
jgi:hypothetical protein